MTLNRLLNADNECVGYFTDDAAGRVAMQVAQAEWGAADKISVSWSTTIATPIKPLELEDVEPGDGDRKDSVLGITVPQIVRAEREICSRVIHWHQMGAASVDVRRHAINRYRRPGKSNRSADLGGPAEAAGVLYVLLVKAPK